MTSDQLFEALRRELADEVITAVTARVLEQLPKHELEPADRLLTCQQVAERLGRSPRWVRERRARGDLPFIRLDGGPAMFRVADVDDYVQARRISR